MNQIQKSKLNLKLKLFTNKTNALENTFGQGVFRKTLFIVEYLKFGNNSFVSKRTKIYLCGFLRIESNS